MPGENIKQSLVDKAISGIIGTWAVWAIGAALALASYSENIWDAIPLMERFASIPWLLFAFTYAIINSYEGAQGIVKNRNLEINNYRFTLWWGIGFLVVHYLYIPGKVYPALLENSFYESILGLHELVKKIDSALTPAGYDQVADTLRIFGLIIAFAGATQAAFGRIHLNGFWGVHVYNYQKDDWKIVQTGPYATRRHPIYGGQFWLVLGTAVIFGSILF